MAPKAKLTDLPLEVLIEVCEALNKAYHPSLADFSLVSRYCCRAANVVKFRKIRIDASSPRQLIEAVVRWTEVISAVDGVSHVRWLEVHIGEDGKDIDPSDSAWDRAWQMLASLIAKLSALADLVYESKITFPAVLLAILQTESRPICRLHVRKFELFSIVGPAYNDGTGDFRLTPEEFSLATSKNLYSVNMQLGIPYGQNDRFNLLAVQRLIRCGDSNIKTVEIHRDDRFKVNPNSPVPDQPMRTWKGCSMDHQRRGTLDTLKLSEYGGVTLQRFVFWHSCVDFATLRTLKLCRGVNVSVLRWVAERSPTRFSIFQSLKCLELEAGRTETAQEVASATQEFLRCIPPLDDLTLSGGSGDSADNMTRSTMAMVLGYHGPTLLRLSLPQTKNARPTIQFAGEMNDVVRGCPKLDYLNISIARSGGDSEEVAIYRQLGMHPRLQSIRLTLDCTEDTLKTHLKDAFDRLPWNGHPYLYNGHVLMSLTNAALDGPLATAIFRKIADAKSSKAASLKRLELETYNAGKFRSIQTAELNDWRQPMDPRTLHPIFNHLGAGVWKAIPHPSDTHPGEVIVENVGHTPSGEPVVLGEIEPLFRTLWPESSTGDCKDDWHSLPLAE